MNGEFTSPNHPRNYPNSLDCLWIIKVDQGYRIELTITNMAVESKFDKIIVYDTDTFSSKVLAEYNGRASVKKIQSSGNVMAVRFKTDSSISRSGFKANFKAGDILIKTV